jgi:hypothetical protein
MASFNLNVVNPSETRPDPTINCFWILCFHYLSTICHNTGSMRTRPQMIPSMSVTAVVSSCIFGILLVFSAASIPLFWLCIWPISPQSVQRPAFWILIEPDYLFDAFPCQFTIEHRADQFCSSLLMAVNFWRRRASGINPRLWRDS